MEPTEKSQPKSVMVDFIVKVFEWLVKAIVKHRSKASFELGLWRDKYVKKRNDRAARAALLKSVNGLCEKDYSNNTD